MIARRKGVRSTENNWEAQESRTRGRPVRIKGDRNGTDERSVGAGEGSSGEYEMRSPHKGWRIFTLLFSLDRFEAGVRDLRNLLLYGRKLVHVREIKAFGVRLRLSCLAMAAPAIVLMLDAL